MTRGLAHPRRRRRAAAGTSPRAVDETVSETDEEHRTPLPAADVVASGIDEVPAALPASRATRALAAARATVNTAAVATARASRPVAYLVLGVLALASVTGVVIALFTNQLLYALFGALSVATAAGLIRHGVASR